MRTHCQGHHHGPSSRRRPQQALTARRPSQRGSGPNSRAEGSYALLIHQISSISSPRRFRDHVAGSRAALSRSRSSRVRRPCTRTARSEMPLWEVGSSATGISIPPVEISTDGRTFRVRRDDHRSAGVSRLARTSVASLAIPIIRAPQRTRFAIALFLPSFPRLHERLRPRSVLWGICTLISAETNYPVNGSQDNQPCDPQRGPRDPDRVAHADVVLRRLGLTREVRPAPPSHTPPHLAGPWRSASELASSSPGRLRDGPSQRISTTPASQRLR